MLLQVETSDHARLKIKIAMNNIFEVSLVHTLVKTAQVETLVDFFYSIE